MNDQTIDNFQKVIFRSLACGMVIGGGLILLGSGYSFWRSIGFGFVLAGLISIVDFYYRNRPEK